jgi:hypothetical protein
MDSVDISLSPFLRCNFNHYSEGKVRVNCINNNNQLTIIYISKLLRYTQDYEKETLSESADGRSVGRITDGRFACKWTMYDFYDKF